MQKLEKYLEAKYKIELTPDFEDGGYIASIPELNGCISFGDTIEETLKNIEEAKKEWIIAALEEGIEIPEPNLVEQYSGQFKLRIPKSLHKSLSDHAKREGISMNQYCLYLLSRNDALFTGKTK